MNIASLIQYVEDRVGQREVTNIESEELESMINAARTRAAREAYKADHRSLTENVYSLTLGAADAQGIQQAPFTAQTDLLPESIPVCSDIQHATVAAVAGAGLAFEILGEVSDLKAVRSRSLLAYAAVGAQAVHTRWPSGTMATSSTLLVRACKIPTLTAWPTQIEDRLIDAMIELVQERIKANAPENVGAGVRA